jgi:hypothetical protein
MNEELEMVKKLYDRYRNEKWPVRPRQTIFRWKCPKCDCKLHRKSFKAPLYVEPGGDEFANRVAADHQAQPGLYNITTDHFTCTCGYEYVGVKFDQVEM